MASPLHIEELPTEAYEAELEAEVQRLKMGDRTDDTASEPAGSADAAAASSSSAAASSAPATAADSSSSSSSSNTVAADGAAVADADASASAAAAAGAGDPSAPIHIEEIVEKDTGKALEAKARGNQFFARQQYEPAVEEYTLAISLCPVGDAATPEDREHLAVFYSNRAAAYLMQHLYHETVSDCSASLDLHGSNPKALGRRARAYEALDQLAEAVEDLKALVALDARDRESAKALARVEKALAEKNEKMKTEMMGKLKDFGNTILGKFGMSLDNFKATQDPATGSYNISFGK